MEKILVLIDNIQLAANSINATIKQCKQEAATIVLAYVAPPRVNLMLEGEKPLITNIAKRTSTREAEKKQLTQWETVLKDEGFKVISIEIDGTRINNLIEIIKESDFDLIIMNSGGRSWLEDKMIGSFWSTLINQLKTPIFIIPTSSRMAMAAV